jgi:hypothetical protein
MSEIRFWTLTVVESSVTHCSARGTKSQTSTIKLISRSISKLSCLVYNLIKSGKNIVSKLNLRNGSLIHGSISNGKTCLEYTTELLMRNGYTIRVHVCVCACGIS